MKIEIPENYWFGDKCVENRIPWMVPAAIYALDRFITKEDTVLEIGSGGSTLFFSDRAIVKNITMLCGVEAEHVFIQANPYD